MKKLTLTILVTCVLIGGWLSGCSKEDEPTLAVGKYIMEGPTAIISPYVQIEPDNQFQFHYSVLSSYIPMGSYTVDGNVLTLTTDDNENHYVFQISNENLIFQKEQSSVLTVYADEPNIEDGVVFAYQDDH